MQGAGQKMRWRTWGYSRTRVDSMAGVWPAKPPAPCQWGVMAVLKVLWLRAINLIAWGGMASINTTGYRPRINPFGHLLDWYLGKVSGLIRLTQKSGRSHIHMCLLLYSAEVSYWYYLCIWKTCWKLSEKTIQTSAPSMYLEIKTLQVKLSFWLLGCSLVN